MFCTQQAGKQAGIIEHISLTIVGVIFENPKPRDVTLCDLLAVVKIADRQAKIADRQAAAAAAARTSATTPSREAVPVGRVHCVAKTAWVLQHPVEAEGSELDTSLPRKDTDAVLAGRVVVRRVRVHRQRDLPYK